MGLLFKGIVWFGLYLTLLLLPLGIALIVDPIEVRRPYFVEFSVAAGFIAFALVTIEFALVSRLRAAAEPFGVDALMQFHRQMGLAATLFVAVHVLALYGPGTAAFLRDPVAAGTVSRSGALTLAALALLVASSIWRKRLRLRYEAWQQLHAVAALAVAGGGLAHLLAAGGYSRSPAVRLVAVSYVVLFVALLARYRLLRPLGLQRRPWQVTANRDEGGDTRTLTLQPVGHSGLDFEPGQFTWLVTGRGPFGGEQHPITIASSAERSPLANVELSIKALGDWSRDVVPRLATGTRVWLDGPYGAFTPDRTPGQGFVMVAGGIGITPMLSMLRTMRDREDVRPVLLFYGANRPERKAFGEQIEALRAVLRLRVVPVYESPPAGWQGESGLVTRELLQRHLPVQYLRYQYFVCGPVPMMDSVEATLLGLGVPPARICTERFDVI